MIHCDRILNGRIGRNVELLVAFGTECVFRSDDESRGFAFAKVQQTQLHALDGHRIGNLTDIEFNAFTVVEHAIAQTSGEIDWNE